MSIYTRQLECLNCSHIRSFIHHTETSQRLLSQAEAIKLPRDAILTCGHCGGSSVLLSWGDDVPFASHELVLRRRRSSGGARAEALAPRSRRRDGTVDQ
jgi:hypothetical protein